MRILFIISLLVISSTMHSNAQDVPLKMQEQLEHFADATEKEELQDDSYLLQLEYLKKHPIDLNSATVNDLQSLFFLTDLQIQNFISYRNLLGKIIDIYELQAIPTWDLITIGKILPYVQIGAALTIKENFTGRLKKGEHTLLLRVSRVLEKSKGYDTSLSNHYLGDPNHYFFRYRYQYKDLLQYGLIADKDAGEPFFKNHSSQGVDFYSFHFFIRRLGKIKALALGDYTVNLGQGLVEWQSMSFGKSSDITAIKKQGPVLQPYRSAGEFNFNRGAGITVQIKNWEATAFISCKKFSGNVIDTADVFSSFQPSGYHRTASEIADRNTIGDFMSGGVISYQTAKLKIGLNVANHKFSKSIQKQNEPYNYFSFSGDHLVNASIDYAYTYKNMHLFGELATDKDFHKAMLNGVLLSVHQKADVSLLQRHIEKEYQTIFGNAFTENVLPVNETGVYVGVALRPLNGWVVNAYADFFKFPWLRYRVDAPSQGREYLISLNYQPDKRSEVYFLYRHKNKPLNENYDEINVPVSGIKKNLRMHVSSQITPLFSMKARVELAWYQGGEADKEDGFLTFLEGSYKIRKLRSNLRLQYFETTGYNSRVYAYENDVLFSYGTPAFFDKGLRYYVNLNYGLNKHFSFWMRFAQTILKNKDSIGSALDEINGNKRTELKFQILMSL